jgi:SET domain-containing protein
MKKTVPAKKTRKTAPPRKHAKKEDLGYAVKRASAGLGLFATRPYKKGERVIEYVGRELSKEEAETSRSKYLFEISSRRTIDGKPAINIAGYINHACRPNCESDIVAGRVFISAIKNITPGDEFTYDYGKEYFDEHIKPVGCKCRTCVAKRAA